MTRIADIQPLATSTRVATYIAFSMNAQGLDRHQVLESLPDAPAGLLDDVLAGIQTLPIQHVASVARATGADPLLLLRYCLADTAPETLDAVSDRFDDALTADEIRTIKAMRRATGTSYIASLSCKQETKLREWLGSLVDPSILVH